MLKWKSIQNAATAASSQEQILELLHIDELPTYLEAVRRRSACCENIQHVYLKWHKYDQWSFVDYSEGYSCEFDWCNSSELMERINEMHLEDPPSEYDLYNMGWRGPVDAEVFEFDDYYVG